MRKHAQVVEELIEKVERNLAKDDAKATVADYIRLVQLQKELEEDEPREIKVRWVDPEKRAQKTANIEYPAAGLAAEVSRFGGAVQGVFGADRVGEKPGAVPGGDQAELSESGADGADRGADVSDAAGRDAGGADGDAGTEQDSARAEPGGELLVMRETRSKILFRAVEEFERLRGSNLAWFGLDELTYTAEEAWLRLEGRLRDPKAARLCGFAVWTPKGYDWVYERFVAQSGRRVRDGDGAVRSRTGSCWTGFRIITNGCGAVTTTTSFSRRCWASI